MAYSNAAIQLLKSGIAHQSEGRTDLAEALYRKTLSLDPQNPDALDLLGIIATQKGNLDEAFELVGKAVKISNQNPFFYNDLGEIFVKRGRPDEAVKYFEKALSLKPDYLDVYLNLATIHVQMGDRKKAILHLNLGLKRDPNNVEVHKRLGFQYYAIRNYELSIAHNLRAISLAPNDFHPYYNIGIVYQELGKFDEALKCYQKVLSLNPSFHQAYNNLGAIYNDKRKFEKAFEYYSKAVELEPKNDRGYLNLARIFQEQGKIEEAREYYLKSNSIIKKDSVDLILALMLPPIYQSSHEARELREKLSGNLEKLEGRNLSIQDPLRDIGVTNFYSAYHEFNEKETQTRLHKILKPLLDPTGGQLKKRKTGDKINIGIISKHFKDHTIGKLMRGMIAGLSRDDFFVNVLSLGDYKDPIARFIKEKSDRFINIPGHLQRGREIIRDLNLDILYYADIGMEPFTYYLAFSRLAPVQCVTWGHPVTTGMNTMDYFISSELNEPENGEEHYTEKLVKLKSFSVYYYRPEMPSGLKDRSGFGLPEKSNLYLCPQSLMKLHPDFDEIIAGILREDPKGSLVLIKAEHAHWNSLLMKRFVKTIPEDGDRIIFVDRMPYEDFLNLAFISDVLLDPIYFGGGNTSFEAFAMGAPIVTLPGKYMRSRLTLGQYKVMDLMDCVANSKDEYVDIAVRLGTDKGYNDLIRSRILERNHALYEDGKAIREHEDFFKKALI